MKFFIKAKLSDNRSVTPEGFLLIENVPVGRTGFMLYGPDEIPMKPGPDGVIRIEREPQELFDPASMASISGKPLVDGHPEEDVNPKSWNSLALGIILNPRRGEGVLDDTLLCDILVTSEKGIKEINDGKTEVSCGYDAEYFENETRVGYGWQRTIIYNHLALVDSGRCGPRCSIGDHQLQLPNPGATPMSNKKSFKDRIRAAFKARDEAAMNAVLDNPGVVGDEEGGGAAADDRDTHVHVHLNGGVEGGAKETPPEAKAEDEAPGWFKKYADATEARFVKLEDAMTKAAAGGGNSGTGDEELDEPTMDEMEKEAPTATKDSIRKSRDSVFLGDSFQETVAAAEILSPGIRIPTYDSKARSKTTLDAICSLRRRSLDAAYATEEGRALISDINGTRTLDTSTMSCSAVRSLFRSAVAVKKRLNGGRTGDGNHQAVINLQPLGSRKPKTMAEINAINRKHYRQQ